MSVYSNTQLRLCNNVTTDIQTAVALPTSSKPQLPFEPSSRVPPMMPYHLAETKFAVTCIMEHEHIEVTIFGAWGPVQASQLCLLTVQAEQQQNATVQVSQGGHSYLLSHAVTLKSLYAVWLRRSPSVRWCFCELCRQRCFD